MSTPIGMVNRRVCTHRQQEKLNDIASRAAGPNQQLDERPDGLEKQHEREKQRPDQRADDDFTQDIAKEDSHGGGRLADQFEADAKPKF